MKCPECGNEAKHIKSWIIYSPKKRSAKLKITLYECEKCGVTFRDYQRVD